MLNYLGLCTVKTCHGIPIVVSTEKDGLISSRRAITTILRPNIGPILWISRSDIACVAENAIEEGLMLSGPILRFPSGESAESGTWLLEPFGIVCILWYNTCIMWPVDCANYCMELADQ